MTRPRALLLLLLWAIFLATCSTAQTTTAPSSSSSSSSVDPSRASKSQSGSRSSGVSGSSTTGSGSRTSSTTSASETLLQGTIHTSATTISGSLIISGNGSRSVFPTVAFTATNEPLPTNTQPCNQYVEFCTRSYGNITNVCAHNFAFVRKNNAASNQVLTVEQQLNDGVRMLQAQTHKVNNTLYFCHTSCDILNAGSVVDILTPVVAWMLRNPFEVLTILIGNGDFVDIEDYRAPLEESGIADLAYIPKNRTLQYYEWPTLSEMILSGKRIVVFIDYKADQTILPYVLDEFMYMWETPFSQTNQSFPCTIDRPIDHPKNATQGMMYLINHNLNVDLSFAAEGVLVPNSVYINQTNGLSGYGSLGLMSNNCMNDWGRYPNFLLNDFYNMGSPMDGSVFEVAARANNVTYNRECCGTAASAASLRAHITMSWPLVALLQGAVAGVFFWGI